MDEDEKKLRRYVRPCEGIPWLSVIVWGGQFDHVTKLSGFKKYEGRGKTLWVEKWQRPQTNG